MLKDRTIVLTGGAGFIGVKLAERLCDDNHVVLFDRNLERNALTFSPLKNRRDVRRVRGDVLSLADIAEAVREADIIVHMAALVGVQEVINNALETLEVNYLGTSNLLRIAAGNKHCQRIAIFSTSEVFGSGAFGVAEDSKTLLSSVQDIRWCYCISKMASEHLALSYYRQKGTPTVVIRPFNVFGPGRVGDHVVLRFIVRALQGEDLEIYGDGTQVRAWCYIDDFCEGVLRALEAPSAIGQAFNIGNPRNTVTILDLAQRIVRLCGSSSKIRSRRLDFSDIDLRVPKTAKARELLGFEPRVELDEGLLRTIEWVKANEHELGDYLAATRRSYVV